MAADGVWNTDIPDGGGADGEDGPAAVAVDRRPAPGIALAAEAAACAGAVGAGGGETAIGATDTATAMGGAASVETGAAALCSGSDASDTDDDAAAEEAAAIGLNVRGPTVWKVAEVGDSGGSSGGAPRGVVAGAGDTEPALLIPAPRPAARNRKEKGGGQE
jgi:hypothetical protein